MEVKKTTTKVYKIVNVGLDMLTFDETYRSIRSQHKAKLVDCFICGRNFEDGEKISLALIENNKNKVLCHSCAVGAMK